MQAFESQLKNFKFNAVRDEKLMKVLKNRIHIVHMRGGSGDHACSRLLDSLKGSDSGVG